jgi:hypothetical protein
MNKKLNKDLALWSGWTNRTLDGSTKKRWFRPDHTMEDITFTEPPDFSGSLNFCFKWLVPKLIEPVITFEGLKNGEWQCELELPKHGFSVFTQEKTPSLALSRSLEKFFLWK